MVVSEFVPLRHEVVPPKYSLKERRIKGTGFQVVYQFE
jgi:hypothetical protein